MKLGIFGEIFAAYNDDHVPRLAASIAYSALFSIPPLFIVLVAIGGAFLGSHFEVQAQLVGQVSRVAGAGAADTVHQIVDASLSEQREGAFSQVVAWSIFVFGASGLFASLQGSLNSIWRVKRKQAGWLTMVRDRAASFFMILIVGCLLILTIVANSVIAIVSTHFYSAFSLAGNPVIITLVYQLLNAIILTVIFALIFKVLPDTNVVWRDVWIGAAVTAVLFLIGQALILAYLTRANVGSAYGAAGSVMVVLLWIYYSAIILLVGAEFTKIAAKRTAPVKRRIVGEATDLPAAIDPRQTGKARL